MSNFSDSPYRNLVYGVDNTIPLINNQKCVGINFDNAATTPPLKSVVNEVINFSPYYSSIHRGEGYKSRYSTYMYDNSRGIIKNFVGDYHDIMDVIYVKNCTEAINKLAGILAHKSRNSIVLSSCMEHHSNDLPWRENFNVKYIDIDKNGNLNFEDLKSKLKQYSGKVSLVAITGASNVTGLKTPIHQIAALAHKYNAKILVDAAQLIPHDVFSLESNIKGESIDFVVFSGHKIYAPFGSGVLIGPKDFFNENDPDDVGGGTIDFVSHKKVIWADSPEKNEAGSPNVIGAIALSAAIKEINNIGMININKYESQLTRYFTENIKSLNSINIYGDKDTLSNKVSIIPFNIDGMHHTTVAKALSFEFGIAVRSGCFCAHPYLQRLLAIPDDAIEKMVMVPKELQPGMVRVSFGLYNSISEIDVFLYALSKIIKNKDYYNKKYGKPQSIII